MSVTRTGAVANWGDASNASSHAVTVPADAEICVLAVIGFQADLQFLSLPDAAPTINGVAMTQQQTNVDPSDGNQTVIYTLVNPPTGAQTLAWNWKGAGTFTDGGQYNVAFYKGVDTANPVRSKGGNTQTPGVAGQPGPFDISTGSLAISPGDALVGCAYHTPANPTMSVTVPSGVSLINDLTFAGSNATYFEGFPSASSIVTAHTSETVNAWITFSTVILAAGTPQSSQDNTQHPKPLLRT